MSFAPTGRRILLLVAACALVVHAGALANRFALDDLYVIVANPLVRGGRWWRAFVAPYWPAEWGGEMYRPLVMASFALDWGSASTVWFHLVNLLWHAAASAAVAALALRLAGPGAGLAAGLVFAVHPVHVEAVANVVGRAELMAALFTVLSVYAALIRRSVAWSLVAFAAALLSKENGAVTPGLVALAWLVGVVRPARAQALGLAAGWLAILGGYAAVRHAVLGEFSAMRALAPVFAGEDPLTMRLTALAALADLARLLVFPAVLRADYSPAERTAVRDALDPRLVAGVLALAAWAALLAWAWRKGRRVEAWGLGWVAVACLPVANLLFPTGVLVAERTLYLPSAGAALALGAFLLPGGPGGRPGAASLLLALFVTGGAIRSAARVPVWRNDVSVTESILRDSPRSYRGPARLGGHLLAARRPAEALAAYRRALAVHDRDPAVFIAAADAAWSAGEHRTADTLIAQALARCPAERCGGLYRLQAGAALLRGDTASANALLATAGATRRD